MSRARKALPLCVLLGGGGHARVVIECIQASGTALSLVVLDTDKRLWGTSVLGVKVAGGEERLDEFARQNHAAFFAVTLGTVGTGHARRRLFDAARALGLKPLAVRHPSAIVSPSALVGEGSQLLAGSIVGAGATLGVNVIVNNGAIVEHDCQIGDHSHIATGARLASTIHVGAATLIGAGAVVRQCLRIGAGVVVGAGAVVVRDVRAAATVIGNPARPLRPVRRATVPRRPNR